MVERQQAAGRADPHADRVEAEQWLRRLVELGAPFGQPLRGHLAHLRALAVPDRVERVRPRAPGYARLNLTEHEAAGTRGHDVELAVARPVVAFDDPVAGSLHVLGRETLAEGSECTPGI